jgi:hypothetical protein
MALPGRNEPCHCGSGRKYKSCHWNEDRAAARLRADEAGARRERLEALGAPSDDEMRSMYLELTGRSVPGDRVPDGVREAMTDLWRQKQLSDAAREQLGPHREKLVARFEKDPAAFEAVAAALVSELDLGGFELTSANARKARRAFGPLPEASEDRREYTKKVVQHTLDADDRETFRDGLASFLPDLVEAERFDAAYVLETCADRAMDPESPACAFLEDVVVRSLSK